MNCFRFLLISLFGLFFTFLLKVDTTEAQSMDIGITGGVSISSHLNNFRFIRDDIQLDLSPKARLGYQAGLLLRKNLNSSMRLQAEPTLIAMGARYEESFTLRGFEFQTNSRTSLKYVQLPILLQISTVPPQKTVYGRPFATTTFHLNGGIFGGYLLDARFFGTNTGAPAGVDFEGEFSNDVLIQSSRYDGGMIIGAGFEHGPDRKIGFETRLLYTAIVSGDAPDLPQSIAVTFSMYFLF